jgi:Sulfotransferase family
MIVSHAQRFIFFHNPKCAGTTFRNALQPFHDDTVMFWGPQDVPYFRNQLDHTHLRLWELAAAYPALFRAAAGPYQSVIFVRNPYARFLSAVAEHFKKFRREFLFETLSCEEQTAMVTRFLDRELTIERITTDWTTIHFSPQIWFIRLGDRVLPRTILPLDPDGRIMPDAFNALGLLPVNVGRINPSPYDLRHLLSVRRVVSFIEEFYEQDFAFLRDNPTLAQLVAPLDS